MKTEFLKLGYLQTNCYFLIKDNKALLIDPADEFEKITEMLEGLTLVGVIVTHHHFDHIGALKEVLEKYQVNLYDISNMKEGDNSIEDFHFKVIYTKGHTSDSITIFFPKEKVMFVGDFVFKNSIGRTDLPSGDYNEMLKSISKLKEYSDVTIYPGHGEITTLEYEKNYNEFFHITL
jgi:glyoxylase-like metal-dependent hydrolase (beta-lactamase superfamily II)